MLNTYIQGISTEHARNCTGINNNMQGIYRKLQGIGTDCTQIMEGPYKEYSSTTQGTDREPTIDIKI